MDITSTEWKSPPPKLIYIYIILYYTITVFHVVKIVLQNLDLSTVASLLIQNNSLKGFNPIEHIQM